METLDKTSTPDPATVSYRQLAMRYGGIWGGVSILVTLVGIPFRVNLRVRLTLI